MTVEELKAEAKKLGYSVIKKPEPVKLLPCVCGAKHIQNLVRFDQRNRDNCGEFYRCYRCRLEGKPALKNRQARLNWNEAVERAMKDNV